MDPKLAAVITVTLFALGVVLFALANTHRNRTLRKDDHWYHANRLARHPLPPVKE